MHIHCWTGVPGKIGAVSPVNGCVTSDIFRVFVKRKPHECLLSRGVAKLVKAPDFDSGMRGFESFLPCHPFFLNHTPSGRAAVGQRTGR